MTIKSYNISHNELPLNKDLVLNAMGYDVKSKKDVPGQLYDSMATLCHQINDHVDIKAGFVIIDSDQVQIKKEELIMADKVFGCGRIINSQIRQAEAVALFACTLGQPFDDWINDEDDLFYKYVIDTIGAELTELAGDWIEAKIASEIKEKNFGYSNRFSPGYCGWPLIDQYKLFSFFPEKFLGIQLNQSALMTPKKSISGIYGLGKSMKKKAYNCSICDSTDCYKRFHQIA